MQRVPPPKHLINLRSCYLLIFYLSRVNYKPSQKASKAKTARPAGLLGALGLLGAPEVRRLVAHLWGPKEGGEKKSGGAYMHWVFGDKVTTLGRQPLKSTNIGYLGKVANPKSPYF